MEKCVIEAAAGRKKAQLVFKNAHVVNVFTKQVEQADVAVEAGVIAGVGQYSGQEEIDCTGLYLCPGAVYRPRSDLGRTIAKMDVEAGRILHTWIENLDGKVLLEA